MRACVSRQLCLTPRDPVDCSPPGPSVHGISQARILTWVAIPSSRGSSQPRDQTHVSRSSYTAGRFFTVEPLGKLHIPFILFYKIMAIIPMLYNRSL